ncbi:uncharacterized protein VTP21DRAFT_10147 [Calcarisporiella thermophila]|uniref:uncharacterized protein n=1 Tax=Calcarisporiella thermophila TaxID=911321 RepID=UPI00374211DB
MPRIKSASVITAPLPNLSPFSAPRSPSKPSQEFDFITEIYSYYAYDHLALAPLPPPPQPSPKSPKESSIAKFLRKRRYTFPILPSQSLHRRGSNDPSPRSKAFDPSQRSRSFDAEMKPAASYTEELADVENPAVYYDLPEVRSRLRTFFSSKHFDEVVTRGFPAECGRLQTIRLTLTPSRARAQGKPGLD